MSRDRDFEEANNGVHDPPIRISEEGTYQRDACYFDRARRGLPPAEAEQPKDVAESLPVAEMTPEGSATLARQTATTPADDQPDPEPQLPPEALENRANLPDPARPYWWFTSTPYPDRKLPSGMPVRGDPHTRLPLEADYWCHEGDAAWTRVDRTHRPKPRPKERKKAVRRKARPKH